MDTKQLEKLEELPYKAGMRKDKRDKRHYSATVIYKKINGYFHWTHIQRTLKKFTGKNVDEAFSHYCEIVDSCHQEAFWEEFERKDKWKRYRGWYTFSYWYLDDQKRIQQYTEKKRVKTVLQSHDYRKAMVHKYSGEEVLANSHRIIDMELHPEKYEERIVEGEIREFKFKGHEYSKFLAEQLSKARKADRMKDPKTYEFKHHLNYTPEEK